MIDEILMNTEERMEKSVKSLEGDLNGFRTGRATPALFDNVKVDYYGTPTALNQTANISIPEARLIVIQPWDKSTLGLIEKAIQSSDLGFNPSNDGKVIRINIPPLTEERRKDLVKVTKGTVEQGRVAVRNIRRDANDELKKAQKSSDITEDDLKRGEVDTQKLTDKYIAKMDVLLKSKESEIMEV